MSATRAQDLEIAHGHVSADWEMARSWLDGLPGGGLNIAHEAVDRQVAAGRGDWVAFRFLTKRRDVSDLTYSELADATARFASVLHGLDVQPGERVFLLMGRVPELYVAALGALRARNVVCPLFAAFGPDPIRQRIVLGDARVLVTTPELYRRKIAGMRADLPGLRHVILTGSAVADDGTDTSSFDELMRDAMPSYTIDHTDPQTPALLHFTSGTTGTPKGALHVHEAVVAHHATGRLVLDLRPGDVYWCTADPGWVTGTSYGIVAPLTCAVTSIVDEAEFDAERWYGILGDQRVNVWYTAPTAVRMLMKAGDDVARAADLSSVRFAASVGEPLSPEAVEWSTDVLGHTLHDTWWQTETGGIMVANRPGAEVRPGSMGHPIPGVTVAVLACDEDGAVELDADGTPVEIRESDVVGMLAIRSGWPSMFRTYLNEEQRYRKAFVGDWYLSGDLARRDADGYLWFVGRADDVIKTAGHLIGPFEIESVLVEHDDVVEAGAYGVPDDVAGAVVHAAIVCRSGLVGDEQTLSSVLAHARRRLGPAVAPRRILVVDDLPKTRSGKILRRVLRARELGLPEGDLSTLEPAR
jgi:acetyl-CoA synthetase